MIAQILQTSKKAALTLYTGFCGAPDTTDWTLIAIIGKKLYFFLPLNLTKSFYKKHSTHTVISYENENFELQNEQIQHLSNLDLDPDSGRVE
jgi:hypothetical protein